MKRGITIHLLNGIDMDKSRKTLPAIKHWNRIGAFFVLAVLSSSGAAWTQSTPASTKALTAATAPAPAESVTPAPASDPEPAPPKKRIAVLNFDYKAVSANSTAMFKKDVDIGAGISDLLIKNLVQDSTYSVIERESIDKIIAEQNMSNSDRFATATAERIGKLAGVDGVIIGNITQFEVETKSIDFGPYHRKEETAHVHLTARLINVNTGQILVETEGQSDTKDSKGSFSLAPGVQTNSSDFNSSEFQQTLLGHAVTDAVNQMTPGLINAAPKLREQMSNVEGLVAAVVGDQVVLNVGAKDGVQIGEHFSVERVTSTIMDPATGKPLRKMTSKLGEVVVTDVDNDSAVCKIISGNGFKTGDTARAIIE